MPQQVSCNLQASATNSPRNADGWDGRLVEAAVAAGLGARRMRSAPRDILGLIVVKHDPPLTVAKFLFKIGKFTGEDVGVEVDLQVLRNSGTRKAIGQCKS